MKPLRRLRLSAAFTLVELLVVLGVTTILATLLLGALPGVRQRANDTKCVGNLRAISGAYALYATEYGFWPSFNRENPNDPTTYSSHPWFFSLINKGYISTRKEQRDGYTCLISDALICPANKANPGSRYQWTSSPYPWRSNYTSTGYWGLNETDATGTLVIPGRWDRVRPATITNSKAIVLIDCTTSSLAGYPDQAAAWTKANCYIAQVHSGGANALLANGSVVRISPATEPDIADPKYWNPRYSAP